MERVSTRVLSAIVARSALATRVNVMAPRISQVLQPTRTVLLRQRAECNECDARGVAIWPRYGQQILQRER
eukprot:8566225-Lingulodinium_polyedra.AAC.1